MPRTRDLDRIRTLLRRDTIWSAYMLGDLAPGLFEQCDWFCSDPPRPALLALFRGFALPILFALGEAADVEPLLDEAGTEPEIYLDVRPPLLPLIEERYARVNVTPMRRMFRDPAGPPLPAPRRAVRLGAADLPALKRLYADGAAAGESPGFFQSWMVERGVYFGVYEDGEMVAAAGTHVVVPGEGIGAIGNVYTRRDRRGRGLARETTAAVARVLVEMRLPTIVLNVAERNEAAARVYERLGFRLHCAYLEGPVRHPKRRGG